MNWGDRRRDGTGRSTVRGGKDPRTAILAATAVCARRSGFHAASMAEIAKTAGLSVGQIYRHFTGKDEIIAALVDARGVEVRATFPRLEPEIRDRFEALVTAMVERFQESPGQDEAVLDLEILAEATRNPRVAASVRAVDTEHIEAAALLLKGLGRSDWSATEIEARAIILGVLLDGLRERDLRHPNMDRQPVVARLEAMVRHLLS